MGRKRTKCKQCKKQKVTEHNEFCSLKCYKTYCKLINKGKIPFEKI